MGPVLCDGLYWELVLPEWGLLHDGDCRQRSSLGALDDATDSTYRRGCDGWNRLHFDYTQGETLISNQAHTKWLYIHVLRRPKWRHAFVLTFDLLVLSTSILLRFCAHCSSRLSGNGCHSDSWDLVDNVHRLHDGGGANWRRYYGWCRHGIGHRLHGRLRHLALHSDQYWLVVEGGAYQRAGLQVTDKLFTVTHCLKNGQTHKYCSPSDIFVNVLTSENRIQNKI